MRVGPRVADARIVEGLYRLGRVVYHGQCTSIFQPVTVKNDTSAESPNSKGRTVGDPVDTQSDHTSE